MRAETEERNGAKALTLLEPPEELPEDEPCTARERAFARAYAQNGCKGADAARVAGYGTPGSTAQSVAQLAYQVLQRQRVQDLIIALSRRELRSLAPDAVRAVAETIRSPFHKD